MNLSHAHPIHSSFINNTERTACGAAGLGPGGRSLSSGPRPRPRPLAARTAGAGPAGAQT